MGRDMVMEFGPTNVETAIMENGPKAKAREMESTSLKVPSTIYR
jgi:hypothetical protein